MPDTPVTTYEALLELFAARCALDSLKARTSRPDEGDHPLFIQTVEDDLADIEGALNALRAFVTQHDPSGAATLSGEPVKKGRDAHL